LEARTAIHVMWPGKNRTAYGAPLKSVVNSIPDEGPMVRLSFLTVEPLFAESLPIFEKFASSYRSVVPLIEACAIDLGEGPSCARELLQ
jgi:hypothetical protein